MTEQNSIQIKKEYSTSLSDGIEQQLIKIKQKLKDQQQKNSKMLKAYNCQMQTISKLSTIVNKLKKFIQDPYALNEQQKQRQKEKQKVNFKNQDQEDNDEEEEDQFDSLTPQQAKQIIDQTIHLFKKLKVQQLFSQKNNQKLETDHSIDMEIISSQAKSFYNHKKANQILQCQCQKWKNMYLKQCDQSARLSQKYTALNNYLEQKEQRQEIDRTEIKKLLIDYLVLYKKIQIYENYNRNQFKEKKELLNNTVIQKREKKSLSKGSNLNIEKKQKSRSKSKEKTSLTQRSNLKKQEKKFESKKQNDSFHDRQQSEQLSQSKIKLQNIHSQFVLEKFKRELEIINEKLSIARKQISQKQQIIKIYREKQREKILYGSLVV